MKKNKWINIIVTAAVLFSTSGCMDSFSDIKSNNKILPKDVWNDPAAITGILANMYNTTHGVAWTCLPCRMNVRRDFRKNLLLINIMQFLSIRMNF